MHPSEDIKGMSSALLEDKRIVLGVTGSIAAVETVKLARQLIRHGAEVIPVMTPAAQKIIHPDALWFATGRKPIVELTGETEHVIFCGKVTDPADLLLISPCTANTLSKMAHGIDDTAVTTFATTAIGAQHPVLVVPAMHRSMYDHQMIQRNITDLNKLDHVTVLEPVLERNKAKLPSIDDICAQVIRMVSQKKMENKKVLIIGGACCEPVDAVRSLCNHSSGKTAIAFAQQGYFQGGTIELWYGKSPESVPKYLSVKRFQTVDEVKQLIETTDMSRFDSIIVCAALSDFIPEKQLGKLDSQQQSLEISCKRSDKLIGLIRSKTERSIIVGFKLGTDEKTVIKKAQSLQREYMLDSVIANTTSVLDAEDTHAWMVQDTKIIPIKGSKEFLARRVFDEIASM